MKKPLPRFALKISILGSLNLAICSHDSAWLIYQIILDCRVCRVLIQLVDHGMVSLALIMTISFVFPAPIVGVDSAYPVLPFLSLIDSADLSGTGENYLVHRSIGSFLNCDVLDGLHLAVRYLHDVGALHIGLDGQSSGYFMTGV